MVDHGELAGLVAVLFNAVKMRIRRETGWSTKVAAKCNEKEPEGAGA